MKMEKVFEGIEKILALYIKLNRGKISDLIEEGLYDILPIYNG